jgi:methionyl-tRNA synthetase
MVKVSINRYALSRVEDSERDVEEGFERLRGRLFRNLEEVFQLSARVARGETRHRRVEGRLVQISSGQRRVWLRIAEETAKTIKQISENIDEKEVKERLREIRELIIETESSYKN